MPRLKQPLEIDETKPMPTSIPTIYACGCKLEDSLAGDARKIAAEMDCIWCRNCKAQNEKMRMRELF